MLIAPGRWNVYCYTMTSQRKFVLANDQTYHVFNRGVEKRSVFVVQSDYRRALMTLDYYRYANRAEKLSRFLTLQERDKSLALSTLQVESKMQVEILAFCLMPNHFHLILRQKNDNGISKFISQFTNSYTRYFNTKNDRVGPLFQGTFKAVMVEDDEQLVHLSRYIHLNPTTSFIVSQSKLLDYKWSSLNQYINGTSTELCNTTLISSFFATRQSYLEFVNDYAESAQALHYIKHLKID